MASLNEYIAGRGEAAPSRRDLNRLIDLHEWFTTARRARALLTGEPDPVLVLPLMFWSTVPPKEERQAQPDGVVTVNKKDLIDRFIEHGGYRIVPTDNVSEVKVEVDIAPEMVTSELAEIYRAQGLVAEAEKIDHILKGAR